MSSISIKKPDGTFERVGDTQGLIIPQNAKGIDARGGTTLTVGTAATKLTFTNYVGENWLNTANEVVVPVSGYYQLDCIAEIQGGSANGQPQYIDIRKNGTQAMGLLQEHINVQTTNWHTFNISGVRKLSAGDKITLYGWAYSGTMNVSLRILCVTLIQENVPYLVANKGALVSGGAFQFDLDGNGYTKNYFPVGVEVRAGTHYNGKPIYQRTVVREKNVAFPNANVDAWRTNIFGSTTYIDEIVDQENIMKLSDAGKNWLVSGTNYNNGSGDWTCVIMYRQATDCLAIEKRVAITADVTITFWYTKTTD